MRKMKKVLIVAGVFPPEPIVSANLMFELAIELSKRYSVTVLRPHPTRPLGFMMPHWEPKDLPFDVVTIESYTYPKSKLIGRFRESFSMGKAVVKYIEKHHDNIDFIFNDAWHLFGINMIAKTAVRYGIKYITPVQDIYPESLISKLPKIPLIQHMVKSFLLPIDKYNLSHAAKIHTISEKMVDTLSETRQIPKEKFFVVRNWQDDKQFTDFQSTKRPSDSNNDALTLMYLGNVGYLAGLEVVIDAVKSLQGKNIKFIIAGSGAAKNNLKERAEGDERISFMAVPAGAVPATQDLADIMILPVKRGFALSSIPSKLPAYM
ncbi:MAG: glycosyltransferase family 4 protein, partial [Allobaculum sp.]|nr:glycosyltransferase family 4 protein [Allobaculum sp.]